MLTSPFNGLNPSVPSASPSSSLQHPPPPPHLHPQPFFPFNHPPPPASDHLLSIGAASSSILLTSPNQPHHRQKLDVIRTSLQKFEQKWEEEEGEEEEDGQRTEVEDGDEWTEEPEEYGEEENEEEAEEEEDEEEEDEEMVRKVEEAGYDRESAYYALKLVNFRSVSDAIEVLASVKQNLVKQQLQHHQPPAPSGPSSSVAADPSPPADPFPRNFFDGSSVLSRSPHSAPPQRKAMLASAAPPPSLQNSTGKVPPPRTNGRLAWEHHPQTNALRHSQSFGPADVLAMARLSGNAPYASPKAGLVGGQQLSSVIRIERNQSERIERTGGIATERQREEHPMKRMLVLGQAKARQKQQQDSHQNSERKGQTNGECVTAFPVCSPSSSSATLLQNGPRPVQRIFVDPQEHRKHQSPPDYSQYVANHISNHLSSLALSPSSARRDVQVTRCVSPLPESVAKRLKKNSYERVVKPCRAPMFRFFMEQHIEKLIQQYKERNQRAMQLSQEMEMAALPEPVKEQMLRLLGQKESKYIRLRRQKLNRDMFELIRHIGIGAFGKVTLVRKRDTDQVYAMKTLVKADVIQKQQAAHVKAERDILAEANSPWIVKLFFSFQDIENLYFIMEYVPGGDMMQLLINMGIFPESLARFYIAELALAVEYVHSLGFIHRDIKPDNILIDKGGHIKLTDFGLCTGLRWTHDKRHYVVYDEQQANGVGIGHLREDSFSLPPGLDRRVKVLEMRHHRKRDRAHSVVGTGNYMAPEVVQKIGHTQLCDWWSVGVILYEMVYGRPPFMSQRDDPAETQFMIVHWRRFLDLKNPMGARLSRNCVDCIARLCCDQESRIGHRNGAKEIKAHPWFRGVDFANLRNSTPEYVPRVQHPEDTSNFDTFEVRSEELIGKVNGHNKATANRAGRARVGGATAENPFAPNFVDFTFRHFFSEGMGPASAAGSRPAQARPSLTPLMEEGGAKATKAKTNQKQQKTAGGKTTRTPFSSAKKSPAPPVPRGAPGKAGTKTTVVVKIGEEPGRTKTEFRPLHTGLDEADEGQGLIGESDC